ncbi:MAG TPA: adenylosuccinate lyase [Candidatus Binatia bacterium]|nr:adenylosuccinate lyase [Candidatus Binatia bacterium]
MIDRYSRPEMTAIWSEERKFALWLEIEVLAAEALAERGEVPRAAIDKLHKLPAVDVARVRELEKTSQHEVIAFLSAVAEQGGDPVRYLHLGLTSSDVMDTAYAVQMKEAADLLLRGLGRLLETLRAQALRHKRQPMIGRTHGIHAEPITLGLKLAHWWAELARDRERLARARAEVAYGKLSGAVGTFAHSSPEVERYVCERLGLAPEPLATQVVPRDRHAAFFGALALLASSIERVAVEIRHLQRSEVLEVLEPFGGGQKGSSAMPHKRNPILTENLCGLARLVRGYGQVALENVPLWHERDISHSSAERVIGPDATIAMDFMLARLTGVIEGMEVRPESMQRNLELTGGALFSESLLLALVRKGLSRDGAYALVQPHALAASAGQGTFLALVLGDRAIRRTLSEEEIRATIDVEHALRYVDVLFTRVFGNS